jgi:hypothetical protein
MYIGLGATWQRPPHSRAATGSTNKRKHYLVRPSERERRRQAVLHHGLDSSAQRQWTKAHQDQQYVPTVNLFFPSESCSPQMSPSSLLPRAPPPPLTLGVVWAAAETLTPSVRFSRYIGRTDARRGLHRDLRGRRAGDAGGKTADGDASVHGAGSAKGGAVRWRGRVSECWPVAGRAAVVIYQRVDPGREEFGYSDEGELCVGVTEQRSSRYSLVLIRK